MFLFAFERYHFFVLFVAFCFQPCKMSDVENQQPSAPSTPSAKPKGVSLCVLEMFFNNNDIHLIQN
jgi:hypothetical protein